MAQTIQRTFTSGEIAPALRSRADMNKYQSGLALCENFIVRPQGGIYSRPGTRYVGELADSTRRARLIPFSFNTEQTYALVFEHLKMRVIKDGGYVLAGGGPAIFEIATPYTEAQLSRLSFTQSADVMTICHPSHDPRNLSRTADDAWMLSVINYAPTVAAPVQNPTTPIGINPGTNTQTHHYVVTAVDINGVESLASNSAVFINSGLTSTFGAVITWSAVAGADYYRVYKVTNTQNTQIYGWIGDSKILRFEDYNKAPQLSDSPPEDRRPFNGSNNKPAAVNYYQQRQIFANTNNEPQTVYTTQVDNYVSLRTSNPLRDDDAVTFTIAGRQVNEIRHILSLDSMILLTSGGEWLVTEGQDKVFAPATVGVRIQSYNGAAWVPPVVVNSTALYIQEKGSKLRDLGYEFSSDKYTGNDLSIMSEHLFDGFQIEEMAYAAEPYGVVWCVRDDGALLGLTYQREHQVWGWHKHTTLGEYESVITIAEDDRDAVYMIVKRNINGSDVRYVERMEPRYVDESKNAFFVDSGLSYNGSPATTISGLDHLEGEDVAVLSDGNVVKDLTVSGGQIELPRAASVVHVGLPYTPVIETLDVDIPSLTESFKGKTVSISRVLLEFERTRGGWVGPVNDDGSTGEMREIKPRFQSDGYDSIKLKSDKRDVVIEPGWPLGGQLRVEQRDPLPMSILSVVPEVDIGGS